MLYTLVLQMQRSIYYKLHKLSLSIRTIFYNCKQAIELEIVLINKPIKFGLLYEYLKLES